MDKFTFFWNKDKQIKPACKFQFGFERIHKINQVKNWQVALFGAFHFHLKFTNYGNRE